jgi:GTP-binding protein HflX
VGYTNAGKSSLVNLLAKDELFVEDKLFATLDSFTRTVYLSENMSTLLTDTV